MATKTWYRGGKSTRTPTWFAADREVAEFYGQVTSRKISGNLLDLSDMGVDVDEWAEKCWTQLRALGYDGVVVSQWNAYLSDQPYTALLYWA